MAARRERLTCVAIAVLLLLQLAAYANAANPHLDILPPGETQTKPIGSSIILTCKPKVDDVSLMNQMQWFDPNDRVIESLKTQGAFTKPTMYTELYPDGSLGLFFNDLQEDQGGNYTCRGTYARNVQLNKTVKIDTIISITWDNAPQNQYPILGEDFDIQCQVRARPPPSVDWLYNGELIKTNDHYVISTYALKIKNVQESDDGIYTCRASVQTTGELQERPIRVEVHVRPVIEEIMNPVDIVEGENENIECKASGKPPPTFTWIKSLTQQNLSSVDRFGVNPVTGVLTITNVNREDAGEYQCSATNAAGFVTANIQVNVIVKPKIMELLNKTVVEGKDISIQCKAFGRPPPQVTFRKHTVDMPYVIGVQPQDNQTKIIIKNEVNEVSGETVGTLTITNALTDNDGLYECVAKNTGGVAYKNGHLTVEYPPSFHNMPNKTELSWEQKPVNLTCIAESIPNATIRWSVGGNERILENDPMIQQFGNGPKSILQIVPIDRRYYTFYKCIAMNIHGTRERLIELREARRPGELLNVKMAEITATTIKFDLIPPLQSDSNVTSISVQYKEDLQTWQESRNKTWTVGTPYVIEGLKPQTPYEFRFASRNEVGLGIWANNYREVTPSRTVPQEPKIHTTPGQEYEISKFSTQYELKWVTPLDNGEPIDMYLIKYCQIRHGTYHWETLENTCQSLQVKSQGRTSMFLKELRKETFYSVELQAHNVMGFSLPGYAKFKTGRDSSEDYVSKAGDTCKTGVAITAAVMLLSLAI